MQLKSSSQAYVRTLHRQRTGRKSDNFARAHTQASRRQAEQQGKTLPQTLHRHELNILHIGLPGTLTFCDIVFDACCWCLQPGNTATLASMVLQRCRMTLE
eukprot:GHRR01032023.1.p3 GENE.GHRR01032023.1~~GHRR01032023.1.p3  ORF type:complete len:101 (-),score=2.48 GHRR01032023.1:47-349(-)